MFELDVEALFATESANRLKANAANLANAVPEGVQPFATLAGLAISQHSVASKDEAPAPDPVQFPDLWNWPNSLAMNAVEVETFVSRLARFTDRGLIVPVAEALADKLVIRDREQDTRRSCMECAHLQGFTFRCENWQKADVARLGLAREVVLHFQRCSGFSDAICCSDAE